MAPNIASIPSRKRTYSRGDTGKRLSYEHKLAIKAKAESGESFTRIAKENGISRETVYNVIRDKQFETISQKDLGDLKRHLTSGCYVSAFRADNAITDRKLESSNAYQLTMIKAINIDKARLMENLSTENVSHRGFIDSLQSDRETIMSKFNDMRTSLISKCPK